MSLIHGILFTCTRTKTACNILDKVWRANTQFTHFRCNSPGFVLTWIAHRMSQLEVGPFWRKCDHYVNGERKCSWKIQIRSDSFLWQWGIWRNKSCAWCLLIAMYSLENSNTEVPSFCGKDRAPSPQWVEVPCAVCTPSLWGQQSNSCGG